MVAMQHFTNEHVGCNMLHKEVKNLENITILVENGVQTTIKYHILFGKLFLATGQFFVHHNKLYPIMISPVVLFDFINI